MTKMKFIIFAFGNLVPCFGIYQLAVRMFYVQVFLHFTDTVFFVYVFRPKETYIIPSVTDDVPTKVPKMDLGKSSAVQDLSFSRSGKENF